MPQKKSKPQKVTQPKTSQERQAKRVGQLNKVAGEAGWKTWKRFETAVINQVVSIDRKLSDNGAR